jgi:hypothetical protein
MKLKTLLLALLLVSTASFAQKIKYSKEEKKEMNQYLFNEGFRNPSPSKLSSFTLKDGTNYEGFCSGFKRQKGQISSVSFKDNDTKKELTFDASQISEMFVFAGSAEKAAKTAKFFQNVRNYSTKKLKKSTTNDLIHFVNQTVSLKNKKDDKEFLMQVINPEFNDEIEVYYDPFAKETGGVSFGGGPQLGGGVIKSYYVKKGDKILWLHKDDFEDNYDLLFGDNAEFMKKYPKDSVEWDYFSFLIYQYNEMTV